MRRLMWIFLPLALTLTSCRSDTQPTDLPFDPTLLAPTETSIPLNLIPTLAGSFSTTPLSEGIVVAYIKDENIWLWKAGRTAQIVASAKADLLRISDDGQVVVYTRGGHLWAVNADGSNPRQLENLNLSDAVAEFWLLPGTHTVYFTTRSQGEGIPEPHYDLYRVEADNPQAQQILKAGEGGRVTFSPDGHKMALGQPDKINVANLDGSGLKTVLRFPRVSTYSEWQYIPQVVWLSNGYGFKTVIPAPDPLADPAAPTRYLFVPAEGGEAAQLALFQSVAVTLGHFPLISPDSDRVAYLRENGNKFELHVIDASTADKVLVTRARDKLGLLGWRPDSQSIMYWVDDQQKVWMRTPDGKDAPLGDTPLISLPAWLEASHVMFLNGNELRLLVHGLPSQVIDSGNISAFAGVILK